MRNLPFLLLLTLVVTSLAPPSAANKLRVVATIPDLADMANQIGGERVEVRSLARGTQNVHAVPIRPSNLVALSRADLFLQMGLSLEHAYVPGMMMKARNRKIQAGGEGFVNCSDGWQAIQIPTSLSRRQGTDLHPNGNPHFNLDPRGGPHMAKAVLAGLLRVDPAGKSYYEARYAAYSKQLDEAQVRWAKMGKAFAGKKLVTYHRDFNYLLEFYGIELMSTVEPKPGVPPAPRNLATLVERMKAEGVKVLFTAKWSNNKSVRFIADKTGARVFEAPTMVGGEPGADTWIKMMDILHQDLAEAFQ